MNYNGQEVSWAEFRLRLFGSTVVGLRSFRYGKEKEKEALYASGSRPISIQSGNDKYDGMLKILKNNYDKLNDAAMAAGFADITEVPFQAIVLTCQYKLGFGRPMKTDTLLGVAVSKFEKGMDQGAKFMEIELPFLFMDLIQE